MQYNNVISSIGGALLATGATIAILAPNIRGIGFFAIGFGFAMCVVSYLQSRSDDKKESIIQRRLMEYADRMVSGIESLNQNINSLIGQIQKDRQDRK